MNSTIFFSICSILYCVLLYVVYKKENNKKNEVNSMFKFLLLFNLFGLILEVFVTTFLGSRFESYKLLTDFCLKLIPIYHMVWMAGFILYIMIISSDDEKVSKKTRIIVWSIVGLACIISLFLPYEMKLKNNVIMYTYGTSINFVFGYSLIGYIVALFIMFKNINNLNKHKYAPLFVLVSGGTIITMIQSTYPECLLSVSMHTFVMYIAYINIRKKQLQALLVNKKGGKHE